MRESNFPLKYTPKYEDSQKAKTGSQNNSEKNQEKLINFSPNMKFDPNFPFNKQRQEISLPKFSEINNPKNTEKEALNNFPILQTTSDFAFFKMMMDSAAFNYTDKMSQMIIPQCVYPIVLFPSRYVVPYFGQNLV